MILSVSRRTDIPNYYSDWFYNRLEEGYVYVRNPVNPHQISRIELSPETVDCIVFWSKNPEPMIDRLNELVDYPYYFQFTLTGYGRDIERNIPHKKEKMIPVFQRLSEKISSRRVIWRYDPILFSGRYTPEYHLNAMEQIAAALEGYTQKCVISFVDIYAKNKKKLLEAGVYDISEMDLRKFAVEVSRIVGKYGITPASCAEAINLEQCGIVHNSCVDKELIEDITGYPLKAAKDRNQRKECGCLESIDIGTYHTCRNGCIYCYANSSEEWVKRNSNTYDCKGALLCGVITEEDRITQRKVKLLRME